MRQLKILHIINNLTSGGAENALINYLNHNNDNINYLFLLSNIHKNNINLESKNAININQSSKFYPIKTIINLYRNIKTLRPDIIHAHLFPSFYIVAILSFFVRSKFVVTEHSLSNSRRRFFLRSIEKLIYSRFHSIISVSDEVRISLKEWLDDENHERYIVIPNGIDADRFKYNSSSKLRGELNFLENDVLIIIISRLTKEKNLTVAIDSLIYLPTNFKLVVVGEGPEKIKLNHRLRELQLIQRVFLLGFKENIPSLLVDADIFLLPSKEEGFGIAVLESIASMNRIVLSDIEIFKNLYKEINPLFFEVDSPKDLAEKLKISYSSKPNKEIYKKFLRKYNIKKIILKLNKHYFDLTKNF